MLVVCQKKAALDVCIREVTGKKVWKKFTALIHDFKSDRKETVSKKLNTKLKVLRVMRLEILS